MREIGKREEVIVLLWISQFMLHGDTVVNGVSLFVKMDVRNTPLHQLFNIQLMMMVRTMQIRLQSTVVNMLKDFDEAVLTCQNKLPILQQL